MAGLRADRSRVWCSVRLVEWYTCVFVKAESQIDVLQALRGSAFQQIVEHALVKRISRTLRPEI